MLIVSIARNKCAGSMDKQLFNAGVHFFLILKSKLHCPIMSHDVLKCATGAVHVTMCHSMERVGYGACSSRQDT